MAWADWTRKVPRRGWTLSEPVSRARAVALPDLAGDLYFRHERPTLDLTTILGRKLSEAGNERSAT